MTIKAQKIFWWGWVKDPIRVLGVGDEVSRIGMVDPIAKEGAVEIMRVANPDEVTLHQQLVGSFYSSPERPLNIKINGRKTDRLIKDEIIEYGSSHTLGELVTGFWEDVWWEETQKEDMSPGRRK